MRFAAAKWQDMAGRVNLKETVKTTLQCCNAGRILG